MIRRHVWTQWADLPVPSSVVLHSGSLTEDMIQNVEFYVPAYTGGALDLQDVERMTQLDVLQLPNAGYEDAMPFARPGLTICNARGVHDVSTSELALTLTLASLRGVTDFLKNQNHHAWVHERYESLADKRVAVIGNGAIGKRITGLMRAFEAEVIAYSRTGVGDARPVGDFDQELRTFDVVVLIAPATHETFHLINADRLAKMKRGALLVNVARGTLVDTNALVDALRSGHVRAALDVTDPEPLPHGHPLWSAPGVLISPHVGGDTSAFEPRMRALVQEQIQRWVAGEALINTVYS